MGPLSRYMAKLQGKDYGCKCLLNKITSFAAKARKKILGCGRNPTQSDLGNSGFSEGAFAGACDPARNRKIMRASVPPWKFKLLRSAQIAVSYAFVITFQADTLVDEVSGRNKGTWPAPAKRVGYFIEFRGDEITYNRKNENGMYFEVLAGNWIAKKPSAIEGSHKVSIHPSFPGTAEIRKCLRRFYFTAELVAHFSKRSRRTPTVA